MNSITRSALSLALISSLGLSACTKKKEEANNTPTPAPETLLTQRKLFQKADPNDTPYRMYQLLSESPTNVNLSPLSLNMAFAQVYLGAEGTSKSLMEQIFGFKDGGFSFQSEFDLVKEITKNKTKENPGPQLVFANAAWVKPSVLKNVLLSYKQDLSKYIDGTVNSLDLKKMNEWVAETTQGKIKAIANKLDKNTVSVFVNALYFKADWEKPFKKEMNRTEVFRSSEHAVVKTEMMSQTTKFKYFENELGKWVSLPYQGLPLEMILALPQKKGDLKSLEEKLNHELMAKVFSGMKEETVELTLPKFKFDTTTLLKKTFEDAGYEELFKAGNFTRFIKPVSEFKISEVIQLTAIEVNEKGTEAAAATAVILEHGSAAGFNLSPKTFKADEPFLFMIRNSKSGEIYFLGRLYDPRT